MWKTNIMVVENKSKKETIECELCEEEISRLIPLLQNCFTSIPGYTWQEKLDFVNQCNCCERHQIDKPKIFAPYKETVFKEKNHIDRCACDCRHKARFICRQHKGNKELIDISKLK